MAPGSWLYSDSKMEFTHGHLQRESKTYSLDLYTHIQRLCTLFQPVFLVTKMVIDPDP